MRPKRIGHACMIHSGILINSKPNFLSQVVRPPDEAIQPKISFLLNAFSQIRVKKRRSCPAKWFRLTLSHSQGQLRLMNYTWPSLHDRLRPEIGIGRGKRWQHIQKPCQRWELKSKTPDLLYTELNRMMFNMLPIFFRDTECLPKFPPTENFGILLKNYLQRKNYLY